MRNTLRGTVLGAALAGAIALSPAALSHFDDKEILQSYRQSWFALVASNFGPMASTVKGEMPWDDARMALWAEQLVQLTSMDVSRGFAPGSEKGTTRAKPGIWDNRADFDSKMADLSEAALALQAAVQGGDRKAVAEQLGATGGTCKACHDEYKSDDYLY